MEVKDVSKEVSTFFRAVDRERNRLISMLDPENPSEEDKAYIVGKLKAWAKDNCPKYFPRQEKPSRKRPKPVKPSPMPTKEIIPSMPVSVPENMVFPSPMPEIETAYTIKRNIRLNGLEIRFPSHPGKYAIYALKQAGFRWSSFNGLWWARWNPILEKNITNKLQTIKIEVK